MSSLPDNDSRVPYCYEIQVHTGFVRGAGSSAEVSIVVTGALGDSEPRVLKDPKRKTFKTGENHTRKNVFNHIPNYQDTTRSAVI